MALGFRRFLTAPIGEESLLADGIPSYPIIHAVIGGDILLSPIPSSINKNVALAISLKFSELLTQTSPSF